MPDHLLYNPLQQFQYLIQLPSEAFILIKASGLMSPIELRTGLPLDTVVHEGVGISKCRTTLQRTADMSDRWNASPVECQPTVRRTAETSDRRNVGPPKRRTTGMPARKIIHIPAITKWSITEKPTPL